jgi:acid phosphatase (class A)
MKLRARWYSAIVALALLGASAWWWHDDRSTRFLPDDTTAFVAQFSAPPAPASPETRLELDELLAIQAARSEADVAAAQADRKTEIARFYGALGLDPALPARLPKVEHLAERVEDDVRIYVRAAKDHFRRLRPYEVEPRLAPCIRNVQGDLSYPSGHAAFAWAMAGTLSDLVPERRAALEARAAQFARQRMVCGVHFASDLAAGKQAAEWVLRSIRAQAKYSVESAEASVELRQALELPLQRPPND